MSYNITFLAWDFVVTGGWRHQVRRRLLFSWSIRNLNESNRALTKATSVPGTLWVSNYIAPNKPASRLPPKKNSYPLPSPNNMLPVCQKPLWNCVFQISSDQIALLSGRPEDIVCVKFICQNKLLLWISLNYFGFFWQVNSMLGKGIWY